MTKILLVDDVEAIHLVLKGALGKEFDIVSMYSADKALDWLSKGDLPQLIVADINMPGMDGVQFLQQLKSSVIYKNIPVFILSSESASEKRIECLEHGADGFFIKPFNPREIFLRIRNLLKWVV